MHSELNPKSEIAFALTEIYSFESPSRDIQKRESTPVVPNAVVHGPRAKMRRHPSFLHDKDTVSRPIREEEYVFPESDTGATDEDPSAGGGAPEKAFPGPNAPTTAATGPQNTTVSIPTTRPSGVIIILINTWRVVVGVGVGG